jgi:hypothetical protein
MVVGYVNFEFHGSKLRKILNFVVVGYVKFEFQENRL